MIQKMVNAVISKQIESHTMTAQDEKIYRYGYILLCEVILNLAIALAIGIIFSQTKAVIFFLGAYIPLRSFCGGWHANKIWKCTVISSLILLLQIYGIKNIMDFLSIWVMLIIFFLNMACVFLIAPLETETKKISQDEKQIYKRKIRFILVIHLILMTITALSGINEFVFSIVFAYMVQNAMLLLELVKQKKYYFLT
ncbi:MAG: accessory gene regulator B family protein [Muricomes sp.]